MRLFYSRDVSMKEDSVESSDIVRPLGQHKIVARLSDLDVRPGDAMQCDDETTKKDSGPAHIWVQKAHISSWIISRLGCNELSAFPWLLRKRAQQSIVRCSKASQFSKTHGLTMETTLDDLIDIFNVIPLIFTYYLQSRVVNIARIQNTEYGCKIIPQLGFL